MKTRRVFSSIMPYEHKSAPLAHPSVYQKRLWRSVLFATGFLIISLAIGTVGYWYFGQQNIVAAKPTWIDAFLCAAMILTGMGPTGAMECDAGKIFSALYAIYSGVAFLTSIALAFSPVVHRFFHLMNMDLEEKED
jgi:hypothetical protein